MIPFQPAVNTSSTQAVHVCMLLTATFFVYVCAWAARLSSAVGRNLGKTRCLYQCGCLQMKEKGYDGNEARSMG